MAKDGPGHPKDLSPEGQKLLQAQSQKSHALLPKSVSVVSSKDTAHPDAVVAPAAPAAHSKPSADEALIIDPAGNHTDRLKNKTESSGAGEIQESHGKEMEKDSTLKQMEKVNKQL